MRSLLGSGLLLGILSVMAHLDRLQCAGVRSIALTKLLQLRFRIGLQALDAGTLLLSIHVVALRQYLKVDLGGIEVGAIHAGELAAVVYQHAAAAAHSGSVHHDRIQTDDGLDLLGAGEVRHSAHHWHRSDGQHVIHASGVHQLFQLVGDQTFLAITAVVGDDVGFVADAATLVFQHQQVFAARSDDGDDLVPCPFELASGGIGHGGPHAAAHHDGGPKLLDFRGLAQRTDYVEDGIASLQHAKQHGGLANGLTTMLLSMLEAGDSILDVVGPLGKPSEIEKFGTTVVVSGSVGTAMAYPTARELKRAGNKVISIVGARSKDLLVLEDEVRAVSDETYVVTDDGSYGQKGLVTDKLKELVAAGDVDYVLAVGPVPMMRAVANLTGPKQIKTIVSLNSIMVDGTGMCGGCRVLVNNTSQFACVDGPEFDATQVNFEVLTQRNNMYREQERASIERLQADPEGELRSLRESMAMRRECAAIEAGVFDE